ncbi:MAG: hypothetical protein OER86_03370, partial [Phycisphaerae bacterium]|nr:hypothetical protein [Phycisphaerae bacterium]
MRPIWRTAFVLALVCGLPALPASARPAGAPAIPGVVQHIPEKVPLFVAVPNLRDLSDKIAMLNQKLALNNPIMGNVLVMLKQQAGLVNGIDDNGGAAFVMTSVPRPTGPEPNFVMILPVTDYGAFLTNFGAQDAGGVTQLRFQGKAAYVKRAGKYAIFSDRKNQQSVENFKLAAGGNTYALKAGAVGAPVLRNSDILVYVDLPTIAPAIQPEIQKGLAEMRRELSGLGPQGAMAVNMFNMYGNMINAILRDGDGVMFGADLTDKGVGFTGSAQFKSDSYLAKSFAKAPAGPLRINRLPSQPFMFAATTDLSTIPLKQWMNEFAAIFPAGDPISATMRSGLDLMRLMDGQSQQAMYAPQIGGAGPPSFINAVTVYQTAKPADLVAGYRKYIQGLNQLAAVPGGMGYKTNYKANAAQVGGVSADQYSMKLNLPPEAMAQLGPLAMFLGQDFGGYVAQSKGAVIMTNGSSQALLKSALAVADGSGKLEQDPGIAAIRKQLSGHRVMEAYVGVGTIVQMISSMVGMFVPQVAQVLQVPKNLPPVGMSASVHSGGLGVREYVPMEVVVAIKNMVMRGMQMQG